MAVNVETLDKLERKITLTLPADAIKSEVDSRLKRLARHGQRPLPARGSARRAWERAFASRLKCRVDPM